MARDKLGTVIALKCKAQIACTNLALEEEQNYEELESVIYLANAFSCWEGGDSEKDRDFNVNGSVHQYIG